MNTRQAVCAALAEELERLDQDTRMIERWAAEIDEGKHSADLLRTGMSKREAQQWTMGAHYAKRESRERLAKLYEQFKAEIG